MGRKFIGISNGLQLPLRLSESAADVLLECLCHIDAVVIQDTTDNCLHMTASVTKCTI